MLDDFFGDILPSEEQMHASDDEDAQISTKRQEQEKEIRE